MASGVTAIVLAGDRGPREPLVEAAGVGCKALVPIDGQPMVLRVLRALEGAESVGEVVLCGPEDERVAASPILAELRASGRVRWVAPEATPCTSALAALDTVASERPVLITTADHALLESHLVDDFCDAGRGSESDASVAVASRALVSEAYPETRRTAFRLRDGAWCGCNLFLLRTPRGRAAVAFWRRVERERKSPLRVARIIGPGLLLGVLFRRLTLDSGMAAVGRRMGLELAAVRQDDPRVAVDVDSVEDWQLVQRIAAGTASQPPN